MRTRLASLLLLAGFGCSTYVTTEGTAPLEDTVIASIGVLPFQAGDARVPERSAEVARREMQRALAERGFQVELVEADDTTSTDARLEGTLYRFQHREGGELGVSRAASVGLTVRLVRGTDGALLWKGEYDETQRPTSESLGDVRLWPTRGWRWLTAEELLHYGAGELARALADR